MGESINCVGQKDRGSSFGLLRLLLAAAVVVGHAPELIDGTRAREPLTRLFGSLSLPELAVNGFFLISGFLVAGSWLRSGNTPAFLSRRLVRIYPGFLVAFTISVFIIAPLAGGSLLALGSDDWLALAVHAISLRPPEVAGSFAGLPYPNLNGAMWTIALELRCYLLVVLLGMTGSLRRPSLLAFLAGACFLAHAVVPRSVLDALEASSLGGGLLVDPYNFTRLVGHFLVGVLLLQLFGSGRASRTTVMVASAGLICGLSIPVLAEPLSSVCGGVLLLAASRALPGRLGQVGRKTDVSYGLYLYAWPISKLVILAAPKVAPIPLAGVTMIAAAAMGWLSWHFVEAPALAWLKSRTRSARPPDQIGSNLLAVG